MKRVLIAHNPVAADDDPSTADVLAQVELVEAGLAELGLPFRRIAIDGPAILEKIRPEPGTVVFHLIEAPPGAPQLHAAHTAALELLGVPFTGTAAGPLWVSTDKLATRALLAAEGLPIAAGGRLDLARPEVLDRVPPPWILKPAWEDASVGLEGDPVCHDRASALARAARLAERFPGQPILVEELLPGRELNVSLLADGEGAEVLPVAEIQFVDFPAGMSRVVGYEAKWLEGSFADTHTVRCFPEDPADAPLLDRVRQIARAAWDVCSVSGYARVDLRLDAVGEPRILEVNTNPCLAAGAGFMAAAGRAGLSPGQVVGRILAAALRDRPGLTPGATQFRPPGSGILGSREPGGRHSVAQGVNPGRGLEPGDREPIEELIRATGFFNAEEVEVAMELVDDRLANGAASHYRFLVREVDGRPAGYACWGPIPGTRESADLYWIVVHPREQGRGLGAALLRAAEEEMAAAGRHRVYIETSTRGQYQGTRGFYLACGYHLAAELPDFYAPGDGKAVFVKVV